MVSLETSGTLRDVESQNLTDTIALDMNVLTLTSDFLSLNDIRQTLELRLFPITSNKQKQTVNKKHSQLYLLYFFRINTDKIPLFLDWLINLMLNKTSDVRWWVCVVDCYWWCSYLATTTSPPSQVAVKHPLQNPILFNYFAKQTQLSSGENICNKTKSLKRRERGELKLKRWMVMKVDWWLKMIDD